MDETQIHNYNLNSLPAETILWEKIHIPQREMHVNVVRNASVFTTMICEDLARSDPCHEVLRSLGPNLVFVLLMDGPQIGTRWSSRYATGLAEDPGSSVLTLTSRGLIERSNESRDEKNWSVGIWKDDSGKTTTIECPPDKQGILLMLNGVEVAKTTLEDRQQSDSYARRLTAKPRQVGLPENDPLLKALLAR